VRALADAAAAAGVERFVLDDGWFSGRRDDTAGLGDWEVDERLWPDGLDPLIRHVRGRGMQFGLWVEPEMVNPDADLYRAHPDWCPPRTAASSVTLIEPSSSPPGGRRPAPPTRRRRPDRGGRAPAGPGTWRRRRGPAPARAGAAR
jgi:hypothetical protein